MLRTALCHVQPFPTDTPTSLSATCRPPRSGACDKQATLHCNEREGGRQGTPKGDGASVSVTLLI